MPGYRAKKRLGQNFLKTAAVIERVVSRLDPQPTDTIVEVGPGRGALTLPLVESGATVIAVEFDRDLHGYLKALLRDSDNVELIAGDFLLFDPANIDTPRFKLIGNLPFNITSPVVDWCLKYRDRIAAAVLMVQKELGERLAAEPGSRHWSPLTIFTRMSFEVEACFEVAPKHFRPAPQVTSLVLKLAPLPTPRPISEQFERVVRSAFLHRRKQLANNLVAELGATPDEARVALDKAGLDTRVRAEAVSIDQFLTLTESLAARKLV